MNIMIFDTETTSLEKPFCYNIGYVIVDTESYEISIKRDFVVEQVWHNLPLFESAYYADKRPIYVSAMKARRATMDKYGYICQQMIRDMQYYKVENAYAYNSPFDESVFNYNCEWFKTINPFDNIAIRDIRAFVHNFLIDDNFKKFCEENGYFTESGNYSTTAETLFRYISGDLEFNEAHTALADSEIEADILLHCVAKGADLLGDYCVKRSIERVVEKELHIKTAEQTDYYFTYHKIRINKDRTEIILK